MNMLKTIINGYNVMHIDTGIGTITSLYIYNLFIFELLLDKNFAKYLIGLSI